MGDHAVRLLLRRARGDVPRAVVSLIAGISLLDGILLAGHGHWEAAIIAAGAFLLTLALQRWGFGHLRSWTHRFTLIATPLQGK